MKGTNKKSVLFSVKGRMGRKRGRLEEEEEEGETRVQTCKEEENVSVQHQ